MPGAKPTITEPGASPPSGTRGKPALAALRLGLLLLMTAHAGVAGAAWSGVSLNLGKTDTDWEFRDQVREAQISEISFQIEDRTASGLAVGANIGYMDLRVVADTDSATRKFDGQYFGIYLRQDYSITANLSLHGILGFRYSSGNETGDSDIDADIDWTEIGLELGIGLRLANLRIMPFAAWSDVDGDISDDDGTSVFELEQPDSRGIRFDIYVERTAFVRLEFVTGGRSGGYLTFVRRY